MSRYLHIKWIFLLIFGCSIILIPRNQDADKIARALASRLANALDFQNEEPLPTERSLMVNILREMHRTLFDAQPCRPKSLIVEQRGGHHRLMQGKRILIHDFGPNPKAARLVWLMMRTWGIDRICYVGRPNPSMTFFLCPGETQLSPKQAFVRVTIPGQAPQKNQDSLFGSYKNLKIIRFNPAHLSLKEFPYENKNRYRLFEANQELLRFDDQKEAIAAFVFITLYDFNRQYIISSDKSPRDVLYTLFGR